MVITLLTFNNILYGIDINYADNEIFIQIS